MIHCCVPFLDGTDITRQLTRDRTKEPNICHSKFQHCEYKADVVVFNQVLYYVQPEDLYHIPAGTTIYASHHVYNEPGVYCLGEMVVDGNPARWLVRAKGNCIPYMHPECWLTSDCVLPHPDGVCAFKLIQTVETLRIFKGSVMSLDPRHTHLMPPILVDNDVYVTRLERYIAAEIQLTTIDNKSLHLLAMRVRAWCDSKDIEHPSNLADVIVRVVNRVTAQTNRALRNVDRDAVAEHNELVAEPFVEQPEVIEARWRRVGRLLWSVVLTTTTVITAVATYTMPISQREILELSRNANARVRYNIASFKAKFARVRHRAVRWLTSRGWHDVPTCVPSRDTSNELVSIFRRAFPPRKKITIDPAITHAAEELARLIGPIETPTDFDEWVSKFRPVRRSQITEALLLPENERVEYFQKIEQLDEVKDPRAIQARSDNFKARVGPWIHALEHRVRERLPILVKGLSETDKARYIQTLRQRANNVVELDFSRFDRSLSVELLSATEHLIYRRVLPSNVADLMAKQLHSTVASRNGAVYYVDGTRMSGDMNTSIGNCLVVACLMRALGMPLGSFIAEGDDMLAVLTDKEVGNIQTQLLRDAGLEPDMHVYPLNCGSFCSRYDINTANGPKRIRHPFREITRFNYTLNGEDDDARNARGVLEWAGVPMLGPLYELISDKPITPVTDEARVQFAFLFGITQDEQQAFENDPDYRQRFASTYATAYTDRPRHGYSPIQRTTWPGSARQQALPVCTGRHGPSSSRLPGTDVRDVPTERSSASTVQSGSGNNSQRRGSDGRRLRRQGRHSNVHRNGRIITKDHESCVARLHADCASCPGDETEVAGDVTRDVIQPGNQRRASQLP